MTRSRRHIQVFFVAALIGVVFSFFFFSLASASGLGDLVNAQLNAGADSAGYDRANSTDLRILLPRIIQFALSALGIVYMVLIFMAGYNLLTARGEEEKVLKAKGILKRSTVGLIVVLLAYSISAFVGNAIEGSGPAAEEDAAQRERNCRIYNIGCP